MINDPRGQSTSGAYRISDVINGSGAMWSFDADGNSVQPIDTVGKYPDNLGGGQVYPDIMNGHVYYSQVDERWGNKVYAGGSTFGHSGCVVTAIAQTASDVLGQRIEPPDAAAAMAGAFNGGSIIWEPAMQKMKDKYGVNYEIVYGPGKGGRSASEIASYMKDKLSQNIPIAIHGSYGSGSIGSGSHAVGAIGLTSDGRVVINDVGQYYKVTAKMPDAAWDLDKMASYSRTLISMTDSNGGGSKGTNISAQSGVSSGTSSDTSSSGTSSSGTSTGSSRTISGTLAEFANAASKPVLDFLLGEEPEPTIESSTSSTGDNTFTVNDSDTALSGSSNKAQIWNFFKGRNYSDNLTAGIMGNMERESGYNWDVMEGGKRSSTVPYCSGGYGLVQWTTALAQRIANRQALAVSNNEYGLNSLKGQLRVVAGTLEQGPEFQQSGGLTEGCNGSAYSIYRFKRRYGDDFLSKMNNMSVHDATEAFHYGVEVSADESMNKRYNFADGVIKEYGGKTNVGTGGNGGLGGFGDGTRTSKGRYIKPTRTTGTPLSRNYKIPKKTIVHNKYNPIGGFGEPVNQQITINSNNQEVVNLLTSMLTELKSTNTGINRFNDKELSVNTTTNSPIINNTTNNNIVQQNKPINNSNKSISQFDNNKYKMAKQIASGRVR